MKEYNTNGLSAQLDPLFEEYFKIEELCNTGQKIYLESHQLAYEILPVLDSLSAERASRESSLNAEEVRAAFNEVDFENYKGAIKMFCTHLASMLKENHGIISLAGSTLPLESALSTETQPLDILKSLLNNLNSFNDYFADYDIDITRRQEERGYLFTVPEGDEEGEKEEHEKEKEKNSSDSIKLFINTSEEETADLINLPIGSDELQPSPSLSLAPETPTSLTAPAGSGTPSAASSPRQETDGVLLLSSLENLANTSENIRSDQIFYLDVFNPDVEPLVPTLDLLGMTGSL